MIKITTRFPPSPTGNLHIGNIRTAFYCWLYTKQKFGKFIIRIEDTDVKKSKKIYIKPILEDLKWLNINWHEGPYYQTNRINIYNIIAKQMINNNLAYKCYCTVSKINLAKFKKNIINSKYKYNKSCIFYNKRLMNPRKRYSIRFITPLNNKIFIHDIIYGTINTKNKELDDIIILKQNGFPTYNFASVIDDLNMRVTDIIRGSDHLTNTAKQINIYQSFIIKMPNFAHIPILCEQTMNKISKTKNNFSIYQYKNNGILKEALWNYIIRLGWGYKNKEIFNVREMISLFAINNLRKSPVIFNFDKVLWLNKHYLIITKIQKISNRIKLCFNIVGIKYYNGPNISNLIIIMRKKYKTLLEIVKNSKLFYLSKTLNQHVTLDYNIYTSMYFIYKYIQKYKHTNYSMKFITNMFNKNIIFNYTSLNKLYSIFRIFISAPGLRISVNYIFFLTGRANIIDYLNQL